MSLLFLDEELSPIVEERKVLDHMVSWMAVQFLTYFVAFELVFTISQ